MDIEKSGAIGKLNFGKDFKFDNSQCREVLGIDFIEAKTSILDMVPTLIETGYMEDLTKKN